MAPVSLGLIRMEKIHNIYFYLFIFALYLQQQQQQQERAMIQAVFLFMRISYLKCGFLSWFCTVFFIVFLIKIKIL